MMPTLLSFDSEFTCLFLLVKLVYWPNLPATSEHSLQDFRLGISCLIGPLEFETHKIDGVSVSVLSSGDRRRLIQVPPQDRTRGCN